VQPFAVASRTAQLVLSMPFPNGGELHVGGDLTSALHSYLAAPVLPAQTDGILLRIRDLRQPAPVRPDRASARDRSRALRAKATRRAQEAILTFDLPDVQPLLGREPSLSALPFLLRRAVAQTGDWTPGPGAALPAPIRDVAVRLPFAGIVELATAAPESRTPPPGIEEIVIPLPLWAQMARGALARTDRILAAPIASAGSMAPLGTYRLVVPGGGPAGVADTSAESNGAVDLTGPRAVRIVQSPSAAVAAMTATSRHFLGRVALDERDSPARTRRRVRIGSPVQGIDLSGLVSAARESRPGSAPVPPRPTTGTARVAGSSAGALPSVSRLPAPEVQSEELRAEPISVLGLRPESWSGHRATDTVDDQRWSDSSSHRDERQAVGGEVLAGLPRPASPQLRTALRFRYAGAPLWWSSATSRLSDVESDSPAPSRALRAGLRAANSAASIWRSILVASAQHEDVSGGMDTGRDASADAMSSLARRIEVSSAPLAAPAPPASASTSGPAYIAMSASGAAGTIPGNAAARARAQAVEMSIVAAIPPAPPPLETMSSAVHGAGAPHARGRGTQVAHGYERDADDAVSHSKIEGSVDAIAQRIYHRIRRRIESDRERFGG
jgi:hypothetical protein